MMAAFSEPRQPVPPETPCSVYLLQQVQLYMRILCHYSIHRCELSGMAAKKALKLFNIGRSGRVRMDTDGPQTTWLVYRRPELLRYPQKPAVGERHARKAVRQYPESLFAQRSQRFAIEAVAGRDPDSWIEPMAAKDLQAGVNPLPLNIFSNPGKLRLTMQRQQALPPAETEMAKTVQGYCGSSILKRAHPGPKLRVGRSKFQLCILVIGNHGEDGANAKLLDEWQEALPAGAI